MTRLMLALSIAVALLGAMALGWIARWIWGRMTQSDSARDRRIEQLQDSLAEAEAAFRAAEARAAEAMASAEAAQHGASASVATELSELRAERDAAMETVGALRRQLAERG